MIPQNDPELQTWLDKVFTYHPATETQLAQYQAVRAAAKEFAKALIQNTPSSADQSVAMRKLRECVATANAAIALDGMT